MASAFGDVLTRSVVNVPQLLAELLIVAAVVACSVILHAYLQRKFQTELLRRHNDVAGYLFSRSAFSTRSFSASSWSSFGKSTT